MSSLKNIGDYHWSLFVKALGSFETQLRISDIAYACVLYADIIGLLIPFSNWVKNKIKGGKNNKLIFSNILFNIKLALSFAFGSVDQ